MGMITLLVLAVVATGLLVAGVRLVMTHALERDRSFRTDLDADVVVTPRESA